MLTPSSSRARDSGICAAHGPLSLFPLTASTGAIARSFSRISGPPMSPAWMMCWTPESARTASGRSSPCVSEMRPIVFSGLFERRAQAATPSGDRSIPTCRNRAVRARGSRDT
jgi:hypothetical protein